MCTYIRKKCLDGSYLVGRTMEFGPELDSYLIFYPSGSTVKRHINPTKSYRSKKACIGMASLNFDCILDGFNEHGLNVATLYFTGNAEYNKLVNEHSYFAYEFNQLLLSNCSDVDDVKFFLESNPYINVVNDPENPHDLHWPITDASGKSIVIEPIGGKLKITENPIGICTNAPEHHWHLLNLGNYVNISTEGKSEFNFADTYITKINGAGSGLRGIPGDWTPASRFVRAAYFTYMMPPAETAIKGVTDVFHVLSTADIVKGCMVAKNEDGTEVFRTTQYTSCCDIKNLRYYYHTYENRSLTYFSLQNLMERYNDVTTFKLQREQKLIEGDRL
ncbi:linear amide C-N hydrolase [Serratia surfactantfaciens]|uniref:linear amide C-N hydrolase n=1 Tax=Serratia surfactantfaciens TaxID=2741499 RepID=UPI003EE10131